MSSKCPPSALWAARLLPNPTLPCRHHLPGGAVGGLPADKSPEVPRLWGTRRQLEATLGGL